MTKIDYDIVSQSSAATTDELARVLAARDGKPVRLTGTASAQHRLPPAPEPVELVSLTGMNKMVRFEPDDQTCSVEPGMPRAHLDAILAEKGLCLPCAGVGTIGGIFATGDHGPLAPGAPSPRSLLLGLEGLLSDGTRFQSGARVVKSVAGFDLHKLFVGSRGRLFAATLLHLKLRPRSRAQLTFAERQSDSGQACARFLALRNLATAPKILVLARTAGAWTVHGRFEGGAHFVQRVEQVLGLAPITQEPPLHVATQPDGEVLAGLVRPSRLAQVIGLLPANADFVADGGGRFEAALSADEADALLSELPGLEAHAEIRIGTRNRRGCATPVDPASLGLCHRIKIALDHHVQHRLFLRRQRFRNRRRLHRRQHYRRLK